MDMANWQNYRSQVNGMPAVFTANIEDLDVYHGKHLSKVVQFTVPYQGDEDGLPNEDEYEKLINRLFKILAQLTALPNVFFAGHFICNHQAKMHFYCEHDALLKETLQQLDFVSEINVQDDPNWDTYLIEHTFHFDEEEKMFPFMDELTLGKVSFSTLKYSSQAIQTEEDEQPYFMVKLEQELSLDSNEIFEWVERFEKLAMEFSGDYIGWECDNLMDDRSSLN